MLSFNIYIRSIDNDDNGCFQTGKLCKSQYSGSAAIPLCERVSQILVPACLAMADGVVITKTTAQTYY